MSPATLPFFFFLLYLAPSTLAQRFPSFNITNSPWNPTQNRTLVSANSVFAAGFYPLPNSPHFYIFAIWFQNASDKTVVWSLDPNSTLPATSSLIFTPSGTLLLNNSDDRNIWPASTGISNTSQLLLRGDGSLVFGDNWSSFDSPTDTMLPNQPFNPDTTVLVSRQSNTTYFPGKFQFRDCQNLFYGSDNYWQSDNIFLNLTNNGTLEQSNGNSQISADRGPNRLRRLTLDVDGNLRIYSLNTASGRWTMVWQAIQELCTIHGTCGENAICNGSGPPSCVCPPGFTLNSDRNCTRNILLSLVPGNNKFLRLDFVNFTGGSNQTDLKTTNLAACESGCLANSSCLGFAFKFDGSQYCVHQLDRLLYGYWSPATMTAFFLKVPKTEQAVSNFNGMTSVLDTACPIRIRLPLPPKESETTTRDVAIISSLFVFELIGGVLSFWAFLRRYTKYRDIARAFALEFLPAGGPKRFSYAELKAATKDFSDVVGQGGFGIVYRGELSDHRKVAVKRLKNVAGGEAEFWAEVTIIARMHHLNLVRMWGFCTEKSQRMLVYEYIPNGSLDNFLFPSDRTVAVPSEEQKGSQKDLQLNHNKPVLDWNIRYRIAVGVARAIAYLHEECLEWVLHCDIKPENILLEDDFCPKVSDFGLAKLTKKEDKVSMSRIRGTRGYLAPEWVKSEAITAKADVYSFGMVLLEIVSGVRNFDFRRSSMESDDCYFPSWAFHKVYVEKKVEDLLDNKIVHAYDSRLHLAMVDRMVKTAMWCLQDRAEMRPSMGKVAKMLEGTVEIIEPGKPTIFYLGDESS